MPINSFLYPAPSTPTFAYNVANSLRFNSGSSDKLTKTFSGNGSTTKFTASFWVKRSKIGARQEMVAKWYSGSNNATIRFLDDDKLAFVDYQGDSIVLSKITNRLFRDVSAWYHIVCNIDTTQGSSDNRAKIYINGVQETSFSTNTVYSENASTRWNNTYGNQIGWSGNDGYFDGYLAEICVIDGQALDPTSFGEFDSDSPTIWKPIDVSGLTFGTNGFYLDFEDSSALGNDAAGSNNFTVNNLTAIDQSTDTCTNNGCIFNLLAQTPQKGTLSEGNLEYDRAGGSDNWVTIASTISANSGKYYYEYKIIDGGSSSGNGSLVGLLDYNTSAFQHTSNDPITDAGEYGWYGAGNTYINGSDAGVISNYTDGDIVMVAVDLDNAKIYWGKNGSWVNSGDPTSGATGTGGHTIANVSSGAFAFAVSHREGGNGQANFGSPPYSVSSGNTDGNGYGNFEYAPPSGYYTLNTKNLAEFG